MNKVINIRERRIDGNSIYIGRGSSWGNPFVIGRDGTREEVIAKFRIYAANELVEAHTDGVDWLALLKGKDLVCYCAPQACHGDVLLEMIGE